MAASMTPEMRAASIVEKYHARASGEGVDARLPEWLGELRADIANAIHAALSEHMADGELGLRTMAKAEPEPRKVRAPVTHMPATGSHAKPAHAHK